MRGAWTGGVVLGVAVLGDPGGIGPGPEVGADLARRMSDPRPAHTDWIVVDDPRQVLSGPLCQRLGHAVGRLGDHRTTAHFTHNGETGECLLLFKNGPVDGLVVVGRSEGPQRPTTEAEVGRGEVWTALPATSWLRFATADPGETPDGTEVVWTGSGRRVTGRSTDALDPRTGIVTTWVDVVSVEAVL